MRGSVPLLCVLCATVVSGIFDGTCPRKDPPPGVLVLSPGSKLVLTCSGHVEVDGVKVSVARNGSDTDRRGSSSVAAPISEKSKMSNAGASMKSDKRATEKAVKRPEAGENKSLRHAGSGSTASPTTHPSVSRLLKGQSDWEDGEMDDEGDYEEEGIRVTRGIKSKLQWKWNGRAVRKGGRDWGGITSERRGAALSLSSVRLTDSGRYSCYHRGRERFSLKVIVADPPENPSLSCYKRSPSSKIRCEWTPQKPVTISPNCYLLLSKSPTESFLRVQCSYSSRRSSCWCALDHNEDELRALHMAYLCVTSIAGNATSALVHFNPLGICEFVCPRPICVCSDAKALTRSLLVPAVKPDPPSNVSVHQEEGHERRMRVTWGWPISWKSHDSYYELIYEIKYRPLKSSFYYWQIQTVKSLRSCTITDAMPGVEYLIQLRTRDEYDGQWSDWSSPVYASSWLLTTAKGSVELLNEDLSPTFPAYIDSEGSSGTDDDVFDDPEPVKRGAEALHHVLWIAGLFALLMVILAAYVFRHKNRFMSKLQSLSVMQCGDSARPAPPTPTPPEGQALVTFAPPCYKEAPPSEGEGGEEEKEEEEKEEEQRLKDRIEAVHFNNTSYFFLHSEG